MRFIKNIFLVMTLFILMLLIQGCDNKMADNSNLFDKTKATSGKYVNWDNGELLDNSNYASSDFISVEPNQQYISDGFNRGLAFYGPSKQFISGKELPTNIISVPENCFYMRVTPRKTEIDGFELMKKPNNDEFLLFFPKEIVVATGRTIELYNSQVAWTGNINNFHFKWDCKIGKAMKRKFSVTGITDLIGEYPLNLTVYDNNMNIVANSSTIIKIVSNTISSPKKILMIGDSLTNNKAWLGELRNLSNNQFEMVGTRGTAPLKHEGRSGFSAESYLTATAYTYENEGMQPFWDGTRFNWNYYKTTTGINPDAVQIFLGTNGMELDATKNANNIKQIVDCIRKDDPEIPIFVVNTLYRGNQDGIGNEVPVDGYSYEPGAWKLEEDRKVFNLMIKLNELLNSYTNLHFVPVSLCHDSEYNFRDVETPVNPRAVQKELTPSQATHPQVQGYYQMADVMFSVFAKYLNI